MRRAANPPDPGRPRFNRRRDDTARTLEAFTARLHEQVDLESLSAALLAVADHAADPRVTVAVPTGWPIAAAVAAPSNPALAPLHPTQTPR